LGPRPTLPPDVRLLIWQDYLTVFSGILPRVVARLAPETPYWPSSPSADYEPLTEHYQSGDAHIWMYGMGVCHSQPTKRIMRGLSRNTASNRFLR